MKIKELEDVLCASSRYPQMGVVWDTNTRKASPRFPIVLLVLKYGDYELKRIQAIAYDLVLYI